MKTLTVIVSLLSVSAAFADDASAISAAAPTHRYMVERTFPKGALEHVDATVKKQVNENNASLGVRWIQSYSNADETKTFCVYEGPSEAAVRKAAELNKLPVDRVTEVPVELESGVAAGASAHIQRK